MPSLDVASGDADDKKSSTNGTNTVHINLETMRLKLTSVASRWSRRITLDTLRPLPIFLGVEPNFCLSMGAFTPPAQKVHGAPEKVKSRVSLNFAYFISNYALLASVVAITIAFMHPGMVFFVGIVWALWSLHAFLIRNQLVLFGRIPLHSLLTVQQRFYLLSLITGIVVVWKCLRPTVYFVGIAGSLILSHAFLRDPKHIEAWHNRQKTGGDSGDEDDEAYTDYGTSGSGGGIGTSMDSSEVLVERPMARTVV